MAEKSMVRQVIHGYPGYGLLALPEALEDLYFSSLRCNVCVTANAELNRGNTSSIRPQGLRMAKKTFKSGIVVCLVAEIDRLVGGGEGRGAADKDGGKRKE